MTTNLLAFPFFCCSAYFGTTSIRGKAISQVTKSTFRRKTVDISIELHQNNRKNYGINIQYFFFWVENLFHIFQIHLC